MYVLLGLDFNYTNENRIRHTAISVLALMDVEIIVILSVVI